MAKRTRAKGFPEFFRTRDTGDPRDQFIKKPLVAAQQAALSTSLTALKLIAALPDALAASRARELKRIEASGEPPRARRAAAETSIAEMSQIKAGVAAIETRARRMVSVFSGGEGVFHGFVSDERFAPREDMTVRLVLTGAKDPALDERRLSDTTDKDGSFAIPLTSLQGMAHGSGHEKRVMLDASAEARDERGIAARVEILDAKGKVVHRDPTPVSLEPDARIYREYLLPGADSKARDRTR